MGAWFLGTFVFSSPAFWFYDPVLNHANYVVGRGDDTRVAVGALLENLVGHVPRAATCTAVMTSYTRNTNPTAAVPTATTIKECS